MPTPRYKVYTDGAVDGNGTVNAVGGWGAVVIDLETGVEKQLYAEVAHLRVTNNQMEMSGVVAALNYITRLHPRGGAEITIKSDSSYVVNGMKSWVAGWLTRGWMTADKQPVKNKDLWMVLVNMSREHKVTWEWVRGHNGDHYNEMADELASHAVEIHLGRKMRHMPAWVEKKKKEQAAGVR